MLAKSRFRGHGSIQAMTAIIAAPADATSIASEAEPGGKWHLEAMKANPYDWLDFGAKCLSASRQVGMKYVTGSAIPLHTGKSPDPVPFQAGKKIRTGSDRARRSAGQALRGRSTARLFGEKCRDLALQQVGTAQIEFDETAQMGDAIDVDAYADESGAAALDVYDGGLHANLGANLVEVDPQFGGRAARQQRLRRQLEECAVQGKVDHPQRERLATNQ